MVGRIDQRARFQLANLGDAVGDPSRAAMLVALMGGVALPASELARAAGITAATASGHLKQLREAGLITLRAQGRHHYFSLADARVAAALEGLAGLGLDRPRPSVATPADPIAIARTCYSHFAGRVAVQFWRRAVAGAWVEWADDAVRLLPKGVAALSRCGLLVEAKAGLTGATCLDWTERVPHVGGRLGVDLCTDLLARGWVRRTNGSRALRVTARGEEGLRSLGVPEVSRDG